MVSTRSIQNTHTQLHIIYILWVSSKVEGAKRVCSITPPPTHFEKNGKHTGNTYKTTSKIQSHICYTGLQMPQRKKGDFKKCQNRGGGVHIYYTYIISREWLFTSLVSKWQISVYMSRSSRHSSKGSYSKSNSPYVSKL